MSHDRPKGRMKNQSILYWWHAQQHKPANKNKIVLEPNLSTSHGPTHSISTLGHEKRVKQDILNHESMHGRRSWVDTKNSIPLLPVIDVSV